MGAIKLKRRSIFNLILFLIFIIFIFLIYSWVIKTRHRFIYNIKLKISDTKFTDVLVHEYTPKLYNTTVVLLIPDDMLSSHWSDIDTHSLLLSNNYRSIALQLDKDSINSKSATKDFENAFILSLALRKLKAINSIIVIPSTSGSYGLPLVIRGVNQFKGVIAIAPHKVERFTRLEYSMVRVQTLVIYGERDEKHGLVAANYLSELPFSELRIIKGARYNCYLHEPKEFHKLLFNFLNQIEKVNEDDDFEK